MSYYVMIRGPAGVGKTTIGKLLAARVDATIVDFDKTMEELGLDYVPGEKWIPLHKFLKANEKLYPQIKLELENGKNVIFDGNFYHKEQIEDLIGKLDFPHYVFTLKARLEDCIKRDNARKKGLGKQAVREVFGLVTAFDYGITIDTTAKTPVKIVNEILSSIHELK